MLKFFANGNTISGLEAAILAVGLLVAFAVSYFAIKFLMDFVKRHDFKPFGIYRIALGVLVLGYFILKQCLF